jgi:hypothetical protein
VRLAYFMRRSNRARGTGPALAGLTMIVLLILHSLIDYPLRTDAIAAVAAVALGFLFSPAQSPETSAAPGRSRRVRKGFADPSAGFGSRRQSDEEFGL